MRFAVSENYPLATLTTFRIGGPARYFAVVRSEEELLDAVRFAHEKHLPIFVLGGGSNILVSDEGFPGLVIKNEIKGLRHDNAGDGRDDERVKITVGAGEDWDGVVQYCVERDWQGIECLSGIPGTAGATPVQNVAAYGQQIGDVLVEARAVNLETGELQTFREGEFGFAKYSAKQGYKTVESHTSIFNTTERGNYCITEIQLRLTKDGKPTVLYADVVRYFAGKPNPTLADVRNAIIEIRSKKGMVVMPEHLLVQGAGSFFSVPVVSAGQLKEIEKIVLRERGTWCCWDPWNWRMPEGSYKIAAGCLLELSGYPRGFRKGNVGISPYHALTLVNFGGATAKEVVALAREIQKKVKDKFGVLLESEVQFIGFEEQPLVS